LVAGTSALVTPAADLPVMVWRNGGALTEVNVDETPLTRFCAANLRGPSGELLPRLLEAVEKRERSVPDERGAGLREQS
jgi:NAD-dependent deacetylase